MRTPCPCSSCIKSRNQGDLDQTDSLSHQHPRARRSHRKKSELCKAGAWISTHEIRPLRKFGMLLRVVVARAFKLIHDWYIDMKAVCPNTLVESLLARVFDLVGLIASSHKSRRSPASWPRPALESPREDIVLRQSVGVAKCNERLTVGHGNTNGGAQPRDPAPAGPGRARWPQIRIPGRCAGVPKGPGLHQWAASTPPPEDHDDPQWGGPGAVPPADE